jgi:hypothetical protein
VGAEAEPLDHVVGGHPRGHEHHRDVGKEMVGLDPGEHGVAVELGHLHVQQDHVGALAGADGQGLLAVGGLEHPVAAGLELLDQHRPDDQGVLGDQDRRGHGANRTGTVSPSR